VPADAVSGIYFAKLVREDVPSGGSHVMFVVRDDDGDSDLLVQTSDTTWQAYNSYGGNSLYTGGPGQNPGRAYKVSYNRPFNTRAVAAEDWVFNAEYPMVRFLERNGYDISYSTGVDSDRRGPELLEHKAFLSVGHDEYWSGAQRTNVQAARDAGVDLAFFSGNEAFWKTRWETSIDPSSTGHRTLVSYKETHANAKIDPQAGIWTGTWRDGRPFKPGGGQAGERADRDDLHRQQRHHGDPGPGRGRQAAPVARHERRGPAGGPDRDAGPRHAGLRVGRGPRQRLAPGRPDPPVVDHGRRRREAAGQRVDLRAGHGDPPPDPVPRRQRRRP
jgi:hypothetical protein